VQVDWLLAAVAVENVPWMQAVQLEESPEALE
jgi:hypothetical protein